MGLSLDSRQNRGTDRLPAGLYVHVPFCRSKCPYCDFASGTDLALFPAWRAAVAQEMRLYRDLPLRFDTVYLGGGTPSLLVPAELAGLLALVHKYFEIADNPEITLEANPDDLTPAVLKGYREAGVNRLSLGVQSFHDRELTFLGRRHTADQALRAAAWVREAGFAALGLDLMYGLPGQGLEAWQATLEEALSFRPEHLSCYQLTVEAGTPLARRLTAGEFQGPAEEEAREFFLFTSRFLEERGYLHYEISNFAKGPKNRSQHNCKYWNHSPYLGLGPAAHSYMDGRRWWNHRSVPDYCRVLGRGEAPLAGEEVLSPEQLLLEAVMLGVRTAEGIDLKLLDFPAKNETAVQAVVAAGLAQVKGNRLIPTREGLVVADRLPLWLMT